jgi:hypothetical protein
MKSIETAIAAIQESDYTYFGLRADDEILAVGDACPASRVWDNGNPTDEMLDGTSATRIALDGYNYDAIRTALGAAERANAPYHAAHHYVIAADSMEYGEDVDEVILRDAVVVAVID